MKAILEISALSTALLIGASGMVITTDSAQAQTRGKPAPQKSIKPGKPDFTLPCCRCLGGENGKIDISTGKANWTVSQTPTPPPPPPPGGYAGNGPIIEAMPKNMSPQVAPGNIGPNPLPGTWATIPGADWLQPAANVPGTPYNGSVPNGHWSYVLKVVVPNCTIPQKVTIAGQLAADDMARMYVDYGVSGPTQTLVGNPPAHFAADGSTTRSFSTVLNPALPGGFTKPGTYFIRVELDNLGGAPAGMVMQGSLSGQCSDMLERPKAKDSKEAEAEKDTSDCPTC